MRVVVAGPGAVGSLFGALLAEGGLDVVLLDRDAGRAARRAGSDLILRDAKGERRLRLAVTADGASLGPAALGIVCVKAHQTENLLRLHGQALRGIPWVWTVQNGLGPLEVLRRALGSEQVLGGATFQGAYFDAQGALVHAAQGMSFMGPPEGGAPDPTPELAAALTRAGLPAQAAPDVRRVIMEKFIVNVGINALAAILGGENGRLLDNPPALAIMRQAVAEAVRFVREQGLAFDEEHEIERVLSVVRSTAQNRNSLLSDLVAGRRTEIDYLNGALSGRADAPVNRLLTELVHALEHRGRTG
ncbi:MAG: ketopantoate reductase family protein [Myxococcales bacterium]|nr:ketopantoate reductase family protein [Myxococcales bacterium]